MMVYGGMEESIEAVQIIEKSTESRVERVE